MKKIKLDLDDLKVESFDTTPAGAVYAYSSCPSCVNTCYSTCGATCPDSCGEFTACSCPPRACLESSGGFPCV